MQVWQYASIFSTYGCLRLTRISFVSILRSAQMSLSCARHNLSSLLSEAISHKFRPSHMTGWAGKNSRATTFVNSCIAASWEAPINTSSWSSSPERVFFDASLEKKPAIWEEVRKSWLLKMRFPLESTAVSIERATEAGSIFLPELSPCWNLSAINFLCLSVNLTLLEVLDLRAQPFGNASVTEGGCSEQLSCGWAWHCTSRFCAYPTAALSNKVSRSTARLCRPQSKCRCIDEYLRNVWTQPSSGQVKIPSLLIDSSPSLLTAAAAPASVVVAGGRSCSVSLVRLSFTGAKLHELDRVTPVRAGSWDIDGILSFSLGICFPGPSLYALQTRKPLSSNWTLLIRLMPSIFADGSQDTSTHSHNTTFTAGTPPHERIESLICAGVSISLPALRWILMCDLMVAAFRSHAALPPCGSEKSRRLILTPYWRPRILAHTKVKPQW